MKVLIASCFLIFLNLSVVQAKSKGLPSVSENELNRILLNIDSKSECQESSDCEFLQQNIKRDSNTCRMNPNDVAILDQHINQTFENKITAKGSIRYMGIFRGGYKYSLYKEQGGGLVLRARIYIKNRNEFNGEDLKDFRDDLQIAGEIWSDRNPYSFPVRFDFDITENKDEAAVKVKLLRKFTKGPYFSRWSLAWSRNTLVHEFGHILGLDDEYKNFLGGGSNDNCDTRSIMCSPESKPRNYHYYLIFRRALCSQ